MSSIRVAGQLNQLKVGAKKKQNQIWVGGQSAGVWGKRGTQLDFVAVTENGENPCPAHGTSTSKKDLK